MGSEKDRVTLSKHDAKQIVQWNQQIPSPNPSCVHGLIEGHVHSFPSSHAVCAWDGEFTYAELDYLSSKLARCLLRFGVRPETFVPICLEKSKWAVVAIFAVFKAGGAIVLIDPSFPTERIRSMLYEVKASIILVSNRTAHQFKNVFDGVQVLEISSSSVEDNKPLPDTIYSSARPQNAAVCLFTSGSTGKPKGIVQEHHTAAFSAQNCARFFGMKRESRVLQWAAFCFDMSVIDILTTLIAGACICIPSEEERLNKLGEAMSKLRVSVAAMTPSFAQTIKGASIDSLETLIFGGEPISKEFLTGWPSKIRMINGYGPAEASVCVAGGANFENPANVGRAMGSRSWLVDENDYHRLAPIGTIGELLIEGPLLARGYLNDDAKTSKSFLEMVAWPQYNEPSLSEGRRLYASGDLAKYEEDGTITLKGRKDAQVKLRGQRIETADVEYHLQRYLQNEALAVVGVISLFNRPETQSLVGFVTDGGFRMISAEFTLKDLEIQGSGKAKLNNQLQGVTKHLESYLPGYMIPSTYVPIQFVPTSMSGKIDRKSLLHFGCALDIGNTESFIFDGSTAAGGNPQSQNSLGYLVSKFASTWGEIFRIDADTLTPDQDFFRLGGDSIMAARVVVLAKASNIHISVQQIFRSPTLGGMASVAIVEHGNEGHLLNGGEKIPILTDLRDSRHARENGYLHNQQEAENRESEQMEESTDMQTFMVVSSSLRSHGYVTFFAFELTGKVDAARLETACHALVRRHSVLRTSFRFQSGKLIQIVPKNLKIEFASHSSTKSTSQLLSHCCVYEKSCQSALNHPFVRFSVSKRSDIDQTLIMRICHAQFDGHSLGILYRDLQKAYQGKDLNSGSHFMAYSRMLRSLNDSQAEDYWRALLAGSSMTAVVKRSKPAYANVINDRKYLEFAVGSCHYPSITPATVVKVAWGKVLAEMSGTDDVVFGYAVTGRNIALDGVEDVVGPCNNAALARVRFGDRQYSHLGILQQVQEQYLAAIPFETVGLRQVVERCTDWPRWTRYSTSVNHQNYTDAGLEYFELSKGLTCRVSYQDLEVDRRDIQVYSWPPENGRMKIALAFCNDIVPSELIQNMIESLAANIITLTDVSNQDRPLILSLPATGSSKRIPVELSPNKKQSLKASPRRLSFHFSHLDPKALVERVWSKFTLAIVKGSPESEHGQEHGVITKETPFYEVGGDLVYAAQMSEDYRLEGIGFSIEDLIECPSKQQQVEAIIGLLDTDTS